MKCIRLLFLAGVAALATLSPISAPDTKAAEGRHHRHHYVVYYRVSDEHSWRRYGTFEHHDKAEHVVHRLRHRGYEARIR